MQIKVQLCARFQFAKARQRTEGILISERACPELIISLLFPIQERISTKAQTQRFARPPPRENLPPPPRPKVK